MIEYTNWFTFWVVTLWGSPWLSILATIGIYGLVLLIGKTSFQLTSTYALITGMYFASLLYSGKAFMLLGVIAGLGYIIFEIRKSLGREA
jgi:hypothetical protein